MERTSVQKLARVLRVLVIITFVCNVIALFFVPFLAALSAAGQRGGQAFQDLFHGESAGFLLEVLAMSWTPLAWMRALTAGNLHLAVLTLFLLSCGVCTAVILWQARRVLGTVLDGNPFVMGNARSLKRAAVCCFVISGAALARLAWGLAYYRSIAPLFTYNALFVPIFLMAGLVCMVMSALFRQAAELKAENDLTI